MALLTFNKIQSQLTSLNYPIEYNHFPRAKTPPFIVCYEGKSNSYGHDFGNVLKSTEYSIDLYTRFKNCEIEKLIENILFEVEFESDEVFFEKDDVYLKSYSFSLNEKIKK